MSKKTFKSLQIEFVDLILKLFYFNSNIKIFTYYLKFKFLLSYKFIYSIYENVKI